MKDSSEWHLGLMSMELKGVEKPEEKLFLPFIQYHNYTVVNLEVIDLANFSTYREKKLLGRNLNLCFILFDQKLLSK